ncbi:MAG: cation transporter [Oscillospiraceae bacterium]|nr:cation transporter [Oscillospiraceae bacterium]
MIYLAYVIVAAGVVFLSVKASEYVDLIDKTTSLSGAFIGGILLSAVTSLPELFTSISSTLFLNQPGLCIGNILGSNLFNIAMLSLLVLFSIKPFGNSKLSASHNITTICVFMCYGAIILNKLGVLNGQILTISITSIIILVFYGIGAKFMSADNGAEPQEAAPQSTPVTTLTLKQIIFRFVLVSIGIIGLSIVITYITDAIATRLNLGAGLAGAIFLGVATSLPELSSTISLFHMKNYNIAIGNIIGSNLFNFIILSLADIFYVGGTIYDFSDPKTISLLFFGALATPLFLLLLRFKSRKNNRFSTAQVLCPLGIVACYIGFLVV